MWIWKGGRLNETLCNGEADLLETKGDQEWMTNLPLYAVEKQCCEEWQGD